MGTVLSASHHAMGIVDHAMDEALYRAVVAIIVMLKYFLPLLNPKIEDGFKSRWTRIRQVSSVITSNVTDGGSNHDDDSDDNENEDGGDEKTNAAAGCTKTNDSSQGQVAVVFHGEAASNRVWIPALEPIDESQAEEDAVMETNAEDVKPTVEIETNEALKRLDCDRTGGIVPTPIGPDNDCHRDGNDANGDTDTLETVSVSSSACMIRQTSVDCTSDDSSVEVSLTAGLNEAPNSSVQLPLPPPPLDMTIEVKGDDTDGMRKTRDCSGFENERLKTSEGKQRQVVSTTAATPSSSSSPSPASSMSDFIANARDAMISVCSCDEPLVEGVQELYRTISSQDAEETKKKSL